MQNAPCSTQTLSAGFTRREVFALLGFAAILGLLALIFCPLTCHSITRNARRADQLSSGRQIYMAARNYATDTGNEGRFPMETKEGHLATTSNEALELLMPRYIDDKAVFYNRPSAYCGKPQRGPEAKYQVLAGECDWAYVRSLADGSQSEWPLLANAFAPGTTTYVEDQTKKGGVWNGVNAIVIWAGGSAEVVPTKKSGAGFYVPRPGRPEANAFEQDGDWLKGDEVKVLGPR